MSSTNYPQPPADSGSARQWPGPVRRIVLTGFMGSGKSTAGPLIARRLNWQFVDADDVIVAYTGMAISDYFAQFGEPAFRLIERETIRRLTAKDGLVLALGGGAIEDLDTRRLLLNAPGTALIHLEVLLETTLKRCRGTEASRPVLADQVNLTMRYERRLPLYRAAHVTVAVDLLNPDEVAEAVIRAAGL